MTSKKSTYRFSFSKLIKAISRFVYLLFHPSERKLDKVNKVLEKAVKKEAKERMKLKHEIRRFVQKNYGIRLSKYIPRKSHNPREIYVSVNIMFGDRMKDLSLRLNKDLTWQ